MRIWFILLIATFFYMLTWLENPGAGISFNAYDLAEWVSLHPQVPSKPNPLIVSLGLRLPLVLLIWMLAFCTIHLKSVPRLAGLAGISFLLLATMPPPELIIERANQNYIQQAILFLVACTGTAVIFTGLFNQIRSLVMWGLAIVMLFCSVWSVFQAQSFMIGFSMPVVVSVNVFLFCGLGLLTAFLSQKRQGSHKTHSVLAVDSHSS